MNVINATYSTIDIYDYAMTLSAIPVDLHLPLHPFLEQSSNENVLPVKKQNVRNDLLNDLYQIYLNECNKHYYVQNKKRYYAYIKSTHPGALANAQSYRLFRKDFKKAKLPDHQKFLKPYEESSFMWYKRFNKTSKDDLREMIATAKDKVHRKENVIAYILGATKEEPVDKSLA